MTIIFKCEQCGQQYRVDQRLAGKKARCRHCGAVTIVPEAEALPTLLPEGTPAPARPSPAPADKTRAPARSRRPAARAAADPSPASESDAPLTEADELAAPSPLPRIPKPAPPASPPKPPKPRSTSDAQEILFFLRRHALEIWMLLGAAGALIGSTFNPAAAFVCAWICLIAGGLLAASKLLHLLGILVQEHSIDGEVFLKLLVGGAVLGGGFLCASNGKISLTRWPFGVPSLLSKLPLKPTEPRIEWPNLSPPRPVGPQGNVTLSTATIKQEGWLGTAPPPMTLWVYRPLGQHPEKSLPCIFIAPAGSNLLTGMRLSTEDQPEHLPYAQAGCVVVAFELDGALKNPANPSIQEGLDAIKTFMKAEGGLANARKAIDFALAKLPEVDPARLYAAGHSSAATLALLLAAKENRLGGCIAYAPCPDVVAHLEQGGFLAEVERNIKDARTFAHNISPLTHVQQIQCPVFLFHADDDPIAPANASKAFAQRRSDKITLLSVPTGGHHEAMMQQGIPQALAWLRARHPRNQSLGQVPISTPAPRPTPQPVTPPFGPQPPEPDTLLPVER